MNQQTLPYAKNSPTSKAAAESMVFHAPNIRDRVFSAIYATRTFSGMSGLTCDEAEVACGLSHQTVSARIRELFKAGRIKDSGRTRPTRSGRKAVVWVTSQ